MHIRNFAPMNAAELMDRVFDVYKKSLAMQLLYSVIAGTVFSVLLFILAFAIVVAAVFFASTAISVRSITPELFIGIVLLTALVVVLPAYLLWASLSDTGHIILSKRAFYGQKVMFDFKSLPLAMLRVVSAIIAQVILTLPWLLIVGGILYLMYGSIYTLDLAYWDDFTYTSFSVGPFITVIVVMVVVYMIYSNIFALSVPVAVFERKAFFRTITRSWQLMKGEFWKILGLRSLWVVIVTIISYSAQGLWLLALTLLTAFADDNPGLAGILILISSLSQYAITTIVGFLIGPLGGIFTAVIYYNQRIKKEGLDIEISIEHLKLGAA